MNPTGFADQVASVSLPPGWAWARLADIALINPALDMFGGISSHQGAEAGVQ